MNQKEDGSPEAIVPVYCFKPTDIIHPSEKFSLITDREAEGIDPVYAISNYGRVWHIYSHKFMSPGWDRGGYVTYSLQRRSIGPINFRAHRLVMLKYKYFEGCENTDLYEVNHKNGIKSDNYVDIEGVEDNLEWVSRSENQLHACSTGLHNFDERIFYSYEQINEVCRLLQQRDLTYNEISDITGVKYYTIAMIKERKQWTFISKHYNF